MSAQVGVVRCRRCEAHRVMERDIVLECLVGRSRSLVACYNFKFQKAYCREPFHDGDDNEWIFVFWLVESVFFSFPTLKHFLTCS
jgi:hypothetical protein